MIQDVVTVGRVGEKADVVLPVPTGTRNSYLLFGSSAIFCSEN